MGSALDAAIARRPGITVAEVCAALGAAAGITVALSMPAGSAEADLAHLDVMTDAYRSALVEVLTAARGTREARRARVN